MAHFQSRPIPPHSGSSPPGGLLLTGQFTSFFPRSFRLLLSILLFLTVSLPALAENRCGIPAPINTLIDTVSKVSAEDGPLGQEKLAILRSELAGAERIMIISGSGDLGLGGWKPSFDWLFSESRNALETGQFAKPDQVRNQVGALIVALRFSCAPISATGRDLAQQSAPSNGAPKTTRSILGKKAGLRFDQGYSTDLLVVVLGLVISTIILVWITAWIINLIVLRITHHFRLFHTKPPPASPPSHIYNQYDCRIHAALEIGLDVVDGYILAMDAIGARFQPVNQGAYDRIMALDFTDGVALVVGHHRLTFMILEKSQGMISGLFSMPLSTPIMSDLLEASTIPTEYTPPPMPVAPTLPSAS